MPAPEGTHDRLDELRAHDTHGYFASDLPATGSDRSDRVTVTVDPTNRVQRVSLSGVSDDLRTPAGLDRAVRQAAAAARIQRMEDSRPGGTRAESAVRPTARRPARTAQRIDNLVRAGHLPDLPDFAAARDRRIAPATATSGTSRNECVTVTLDPGSTDGGVAADPGWLANASTAQIGNAVTQAFENAYGERDQS